MLCFLSAPYVKLNIFKTNTIFVNKRNIFVGSKTEGKYIITKDITLKINQNKLLLVITFLWITVCKRLSIFNIILLVKTLETLLKYVQTIS